MRGGGNHYRIRIGVFKLQYALIAEKPLVRHQGEVHQTHLPIDGRADESEEGPDDAGQEEFREAQRGTYGSPRLIIANWLLSRTQNSRRSSRSSWEA